MAARKPCAKCGGDKGPTPTGRGGHRYCPDCRELTVWEQQRRRKAKFICDRKPCERCGGRKPPGRAVRLCVACQGWDAPKCMRCQEAAPRPGGRLCEECVEVARVEKRARQAAWRRKQRSNPKNKAADNRRDAARRKRQRRRKGAAEAEREAIRLNHWLMMEREGRLPEPAEHAPGKQFPKLPARPLAIAIQAMIDREDRYLNVFAACPRDKGESLGPVCERLGIEQRTYTGWRCGERVGVEFDQVDMVLTCAGWLWWEVFTEETCRRPILTVAIRKKRSNGQKRWTMATIRRVWYGDWGTVPRLDGEGFEDGVDREALARVEHAFTGEGEPAVVSPSEESRGAFGTTIEEYKQARRERGAQRQAVAA